MLKIQYYVTGIAQSVWTFLILALVLGTGIGLAVILGGSPYIVAAIIIAGIFVGITLINVELGFLLLILMLYLRVSDIAVNVYGLPSLARPFIGFLFAAAAMRWLLNGSLPRGWIRPLVLVGLYGIVIFLSLFYAVDVTRATMVLDDFVKDGIIAVLITMLVQHGATLRRLAWVLILAGIFTGSISVYQFLTGSFDNTFWGFAEAPVLNIVGEMEGNRIAGMLGSPNYYAQILVILIPLAINQLWDERSIGLKFLAAWSAVVCVLSVIFTYSRGGFVALAIAVLAIIIYRRMKLPFVLVLVAFGILIFRFIPNPFFERLETIPDVVVGESSYIDEVSFRGRLSELIVAAQMFSDHPLLGVGADNYPVYYQEYSRRVGLDPRTEQRQAHNLFLRVAAETGIFGLLTFGLILWVMIRSIFQAHRSFSERNLKRYANLVAAFGISILGFLSDSLFTHNAFPRYFWMLVGIAFALPQVAAHTDKDYAEKNNPSEDGV